MMDKNLFWKIIEEGRSVGGNVYNSAPIVSQLLAVYPPNDLVLFVQHQTDLLDESYRQDLWAVAYIMNGGCSDDCFEYFRAWLMANGKERWDAAMKHPESIGYWVNWNAIAYEYEDLLYTGTLAYRAKTGKPFPYTRLDSNRPSQATGTPWNENELSFLYPELSKKRAASWSKL